MISGIARFIFGLFWRGALITFILLGGAVLLTAISLPPVADQLDGRARGSVTLLDRNGEVFAWRGDQYTIVSEQTVSPHLRNAVVATEDRRFYRHIGVSPRGIASAIRINLREGRGPLSGHGGSTITQQTAKLLCLGTPFDPDVWKSEAAYEAECRQGSLWRKISEAVYALGMELRYTKGDILTIYLNRAFLGAGARGVEAASQRYFGKPAATVTPSEAAMIAGLLVAPTRYAPTNDLERSRDRAATVLRLMADQGYLSETEYALATANPASLSRTAQAKAGGYFADWMMAQGPEFLTRKTTEDVLITTTFDPKIQKAAEAAVDTVFINKVSKGSKAQVAIVVMSADGAVRAMVGGRQTGVTGGFNRAIHAKRQMGSAFKPFVYAAALDLGRSPLDIIIDEPITLTIPGSGTWSPRNYTKEFKGPVTLTQALRDSLNIPAVKLSESVGRDVVRTVATGFGLGPDLAQGPALALGASEGTLLDLTAAYAGLLNGGSSVASYGVLDLRFVGDDDPLVGQTGGIGERVLTQKATEELIYMMHDVVENGTGARARLDGHPAAGKTGTTQAARDAWFVGFTAEYVAGVWMGYDDNTPLTGVTGGGLPAEIWHDMMASVTQGTQSVPLPMRAPTQKTPEQLDGGTLFGPSAPNAPQEPKVDGFIRRLIDGLF